MPTPNLVKYATSNQDGCLKSKNVLLAVSDSVDYGPTSNTGFWNGITPPASGYTIYTLPSGSTTPSIVCPSTDSALIYWAKALGGVNISTVSDGISYITTALTNSVVVNVDYPNISTSGLSLFIDSSYIPSYPTTGTRWYDLTGNQYNSNMVGTVSFNTTYPQFFDYQNTPNYFSGTSSLAASITDNITIISWIQANGISSRSVIFDKYQTTTPYGYSFEAGTIAGLWTNTIRFYAQGSNAFSTDFRGVASALTQSAITMVTATYSRTAVDTKMYINNTVISATQAGNPTSIDSTWSQGSNNFTLGTFRPEISIDSNMRQYSVLVYNRVLSATEISSVFSNMALRYENLNIVTSGLVLMVDAGFTASYPTLGTTIYDISSSVYNGTLVNGPTFNTANSGSIVFDGSNDYINFGNVLDFPTSAFSISAWIKTSSVNSGPWTIVSKESMIDPYVGYQLGFNTVTGAAGDIGKIGFSLVCNAGGIVPIRKLTTATYNDGGWKNVVGTYDGTTYVSGLTIYVNGSSATTTTSDTRLLNNISTPTNFEIGARDGAQQPFPGNIAVVMVYNKQLSSTEVLQNYNALKSRYGL